MKYTPISEEEFERLEREAAASRIVEPAIVSVNYLPPGKIAMSLRNGSSVVFFAAKVKGLEEASDADLADVRAAEEGTVLEFPSLDQHYQLTALLEIIFQLPTARAMGSKGGSSRSQSKTAASRANGTKGGRPRKVREPAQT